MLQENGLIKQKVIAAICIQIHKNFDLSSGKSK